MGLWKGFLGVKITRTPYHYALLVLSCRQLKIVRSPKSTTAFVEFVDVPTAMMVHEALQGAVLGSSDRGGIRIQYSKNPYGRREVGAPGMLPQGRGDQGSVGSDSATSSVAGGAKDLAAHLASTNLLGI